MSEKPTGRTRLRPFTISWRAPVTLLVLQVEVGFPDGPRDHNGMPEYHAGRRWRDAQVEDLSVEAITSMVRKD